MINMLFCARDTRQENLRVLFSTGGYPSVWDQRRIIEDAIIQAAAEANHERRHK
jgi:hypothetical protein